MRSETEQISANRASGRAEKRKARARATRTEALSLRRVLSLLLSLPVIAGCVALNIYVLTSPYPPTQAITHLLAMGGCDTARSLGLRNMRVGEPGYHARLDPDRNGVACETAHVEHHVERQPGNAKFVKP